MRLWAIGAILAAAYLVVTWAVDTGRSASHRRKAGALLSQGDWEGAADVYKKAILARIDSSKAVADFAKRLSDLYGSHGVAVDLARVLECPLRLRQIVKSKAPDKEKARLIGELIDDTRRWLETLP